MIIELISTGTELLLGQIVNTNAAYLSRRLNELGYSVVYQSTVGDNRQRMETVLATALSRADIVITTGGLGPTQGDITKEVTAKLLNLPLDLHEASTKRIRCYFDNRHSRMPESNIRQAMLPQGAIAIDNDWGTAPGVILETNGKVIIHLPGPPHEMEPMFEHKLVPYFAQRFGEQGIILSKVLRTYGIGESSLEEKIQDLVKQQTNPTLALLARNGEIHVRLTAKSPTRAEAQMLIEHLENKIRERLHPYIFGVEEETLELVAGKLLDTKQLTLSVAESCTGGLVSSKITDIAGSSSYLTGSVVCYTNPIKIAAVGVPAATLQQFGAVSEQTARAMASGIRERFSTNIGLSITGLAGPGGATPDKPVGLVYIGVAGPNGIEHYQYHFTGTRTAIKQRAALAALSRLVHYIERL